MIARPFLASLAGPVIWRVLAVVVAATVVAAQFVLPLRLPVSDPVAGAPAAGPPPSPRATPPAPPYSAIAAHPLFSPTRKPYVPPPPAPPPAAAETSPLHDYRLLGTVVEGNTRIALLKPPGGHMTIRAVPGQTIAGWKLRAITPDTLEFENGAARFALHFPQPRWPHP